MNLHFSRSLFALAAVCWLLSGCAARLPGTSSLPAPAQDEIRALFADFTHRQCPDSLDADATLEIRLLGQTERASGILQLKQPSYLRYSANDPLGRSLFILVSDGRTFTMIDNLEAKAVTGPVESAFWHEYLPEYLDPEDLFAWLAGRMPEPVPLISEVRVEKEGSAFWLFFDPVEDLSHVIRFDPRQQLITRHLLQDDGGTSMLDVSYDSYSPELACPVPALLTIQGESFRGTISIHYNRLYENPDFSPTLFTIAIPPHFKVRQVE